MNVIPAQVAGEPRRTPRHDDPRRDGPTAARIEAGITPGLLRLSVGIEATEDLLADLRAGLDRARKAR